MIDFLTVALSERQFEVITANTLDEAVAAIYAGPPFEMALLDMRLKQGRGEAVAKHLIEKSPDCPGNKLERVIQ